MKTHIITGKTGSRKSSYFDRFASVKQQVIFACATNQQAIQQHTSYSERNTNANACLVVSTQYKLSAQLKLTPIFFDKQYDWSIPELDIDAMRVDCAFDKLPAFDEIVSKPDVIDINADIIFITHARLTAMNLDTLPNHAIVYDDIQLRDFNYLFCSKKLYNDVYITNGAFKHSIQSFKVDKSTFFIRPEKFRILNNAVNHDVYFTCVEQNCIDYIQYKYPDTKIIALDAPIKTEQKYHIIGTDITQKTNQDAFAHIIRIARETGGICIADGIDADVNHMQCPGRNDLIEHDILVKISQPHQNLSIIQTTFLQLEGFDISKYQNMLNLMYNQLIQALGRNQMHRSTGGEMVAFVDPALFKYLTKIGFVSSDMNDDHPFIDECMKLLEEYNSVVSPKQQAKKDTKIKQIQDMIADDYTKREITRKLNLNKYNILDKKEVEAIFSNASQ